MGQLGSSLDVSPTVLGFIGRPYETMFFGQDLLRRHPEAGRALLNHNRDIGLLARDRLVVLGLLQTVEFYAGDPKRVEMNWCPNRRRPTGNWSAMPSPSTRWRTISTPTGATGLTGNEPAPGRRRTPGRLYPPHSSGLGRAALTMA